MWKTQSFLSKWTLNITHITQEPKEWPMYRKCSNGQTDLWIKDLVRTFLITFIHFHLLWKCNIFHVTLNSRKCLYMTLKSSFLLPDWTWYFSLNEYNFSKSTIFWDVIQSSIWCLVLTGCLAYSSTLIRNVGKLPPKALCHIPEDSNDLKFCGKITAVHSGRHNI
jgi:hypothetical protein